MNIISSSSTDSTVISRLFSKRKRDNTISRFNEVLGYPNSINFQSCLDMYKNSGIAQKIVKALTDEVWANPPMIKAVENDSSSHVFADDYRKFSRRVNLEQVFREAEILAKIGRFSVIYLGIDSGSGTESPVEGIDSFDDIEYVKAFGEDAVSVEELNSDLTSPYYGTPEIYRFKESLGEVPDRFKRDCRDIFVHRTRMTHIVYSDLGQQVWGEYYLQPIFPKLIDLNKVVGGGANMFWLNGRGGISVDFKEGFAPPSDKVKKEAHFREIQESYADYSEGIKRLIVSHGLEYNPINHVLPSPKPFFEALMGFICGTYGIPWRMLLGTEQGSQSSTEDRNNFEQTVTKYRSSFSEPVVLRGFINHALELGAYAGYADYAVEWNQLYGLSEIDEMEILAKKMEMIEKYAASDGAIALIPPEQFLDVFLKLPEDVIIDIKTRKDSSIVMPKNNIQADSKDSNGSSNEKKSNKKPAKSGSKA